MRAEHPQQWPTKARKTAKDIPGLSLSVVVSAFSSFHDAVSMSFAVFRAFVVHC